MKKRRADGPFVFSVKYTLEANKPLFLTAAAAVTAAAAAGSTGTASTAAAAFSFFLVANHTPDDQTNDQSQHRNDNDITHGHWNSHLSAF